MHAKHILLCLKSCSKMVECLFASWKWPAQQNSPRTQVRDFTKKGMLAKHTHAAVLDRSAACESQVVTVACPYCNWLASVVGVSQTAASCLSSSCDMRREVQGIQER